ncbi:glycoside hydrolase family 3 C-terminal domain-containing protein [Seonamhaeicola sp.]|uniref:glycoside hydrolase family 3 C-terminal domain-containing protein n=1 Tax=Seonamhaeicola sp. TaxID=1912245 RepID=UPI0026144CAE|nr:glycoside hydrolase family 3 C-terminal domain-containing protein [Seonamhaeicola sp.]
MKQLIKNTFTVVFTLFYSITLFGQELEFPFKNPELPINERVEDLINRLTLQEKADLLWELAPAIERLGIPKYYHGNEALHGVVRPGKFTVFPQAIAFGATFNPDLMKEVSTAISTEARGRWNELNYGKEQKRNHSDLLTFWSPTINMARDPRWGRTAETYGEDPYLTSKIGVQFVKGLQGNHPKYLKVVSTPKHYVANNVETNRFSANSAISERTLREYYLPAFKAAITEGKAESIMAAYNAVNWVPSNANRWLLIDLLRREWKFKGYVVSDCGNPHLLKNAHKFTKNFEDAAAASLRGGMDLECNGGGYIMRDYLVKAAKQGKITIEEIDYALTNVLRARMKLGIFDPIGLNPYNKIRPEVVGCKEHQELALKTALESIVLLENKDDILPINPKKIKSIAIIGHNANQTIFGDYSGVPLNEAVSPYEGIKGLVGKNAKINYVDTKLNFADLNMVRARFLQTPHGKNGLKATYFSNMDLEGEGKTRTDAKIDIHFQDNPPDPYLAEKEKSIRWEGNMLPPVTGTYDLAIKASGKVKLWINNKLIIDGWGKKYDNRIAFHFDKNKKYSIKMEWADKGSGHRARLFWKTPDNYVNSYDAEIEAAKKSDIVIAVIGTGMYNEKEGHDKKHLNLPGDQIEMLKAVYKVNPNIVVVLITGSQHTIPWVKEHIPGIVNAWYPGEQGGTAIADILFGDYNPAGRLPITYYETVETLPAMERYEVSEGRTYLYYHGKPLWEFGYGLSYSTFEYSDLKISSKTLKADAKLQINVSIKNTSKIDGDEVVQLYVAYPGSKKNRPLQQLRGFKRVAIKKGKTENVSFSLTKDDLKYWSTAKQDWDVETGKVDIMIGASSKDIKLATQIDVE